MRGLWVDTSKISTANARDVLMRTAIARTRRKRPP